MLVVDSTNLTCQSFKDGKYIYIEFEECDLETILDWMIRKGKERENRRRKTR